MMGGNGGAAVDIEERIGEAFREMSVRATRPREVIAHQLMRLGEKGESFSTEDLLRRLRRSTPGIGRATVYRSVEKLVHLKLLDRIDFEDGSHVYRLCGSAGHHHHLACTRCHRVVDLDFCLDKKEMEAIGRREHFHIENHAITLYGRCRECAPPG